MEKLNIVQKRYEIRGDLNDLERRWQQINANSPYKKHSEVRRYENRRQAAITCSNLIYNGLESVLNLNGMIFN